MTAPHRPPAHSSIAAVEDRRTGSGLSPRDLGPVRYSRRPLRVDAMRVSQSNAAEVADWCGGSVLGNAVRVPFTRGEDRWELLAKPGYWVVMESEGACMVDVLTDVEFAHSMKQVNA